MCLAVAPIAEQGQGVAQEAGLAVQVDTTALSVQVGAGDTVIAVGIGGLIPWEGVITAQAVEVVPEEGSLRKVVVLHPVGIGLATPMPEEGTSTVAAVAAAVVVVLIVVLAILVVRVEGAGVITKEAFSKAICRVKSASEMHEC